LTERPKENTLPVGIDSDIISYRCAWSSEGGSQEDAKEKVDEVVDSIVYQLCGDFPDFDKVQHYLTGKGNFRYDYAKTHVYKDNRSGTKKPEHIGYIRDYLVEEYGAIVVDGKWYKPTTYEANLSLYSQILTGDRVDNIIGLHRVGPVTASKMLEEAETEEDMWEICLKAYDGDYDRVVENARLLYLQRREEEIWQPPKGSDT